jgi:predicted ATP-dependent serine protease
VRLVNIRSGDRILFTLSINEEHINLFVVRYCKNKFFELTKIFFFYVKETGLRAVVDSVLIIFKI